MPKHDPLSAKGIANRQKSIGLQKLRWYCQMCQKQCRDENGFKCHTMSEGHLRQMKIFADNSGRILDEFSREFERGFLQTLSGRHGTKRVSANKVYQEYIQDKHHIHMNGTVWTTLTGLCLHLGKSSKCIVDETDKGWFIQYIDKDPKVLARQAMEEQRLRDEQEEEERNKLEIEAQILAAERKRKEQGIDDVTGDNNLARENENEKISVALNVSQTNNNKKRVHSNVFGDSNVDDDEENDEDKAKAEDYLNKKSKLSAVIDSNSKDKSHNNERSRYGYSDNNSNKSTYDRKYYDDNNRKYDNNNNHRNESYGKSTYSSDAYEREHDYKSSQSKYNNNNNNNNNSSSSSSSNRKDYWLFPNIIVKIVNKKVKDGKYYHQKGCVQRIHKDNKYVGEILMDDDEVLILDQDDVETVIPKEGNEVLIINGKGRGDVGILDKIHHDDGYCDVLVKDKDSPYYNTIIKGIHYEDLCKYYREK